jgi:hypothetical protein
MNDLEKQLKSEIAALDQERFAFSDLWEKLAAMCHPRRKHHTSRAQGVTPSPTLTDAADIIDITAQQSNQTLASGQMAHITPMGQRWFALEPPEKLKKNPAAIRYYSEVSTSIAKHLASSNFYNELHEQYLDRGCFGIAALETLPGPENRGVWFRTFSPGTFSIAEDSYGRVTRISRSYQLTAAQAVDQFGKDNLPEVLRKAHDTGTQDKFGFIHYIKPNPAHEKGNPFSPPILSFDICTADEWTILRKARYNSFPVAVSRWLKWGENCAYGIGPAFFALPAAQQANYLETLADHLGELAAFPRFLTPASLKGEIDLSPGGMTTFDPNMGSDAQPREWLTGGRYDIMEARLERKKQQIEKAFFVQLFELITQNDKVMTATEVQQAVAEKGALFHPIFVRAVTELTTPVILRAYEILAQQPGALPTPPPDVILQEGDGPFIPDPDVKYVSPLALAITENQIGGLNNVLAIMQSVAAFAPDALDAMNTDAIFPAVARAHALPEEFIRSPEQIADLQQARAQQMQMQQAEQAASAAQKLGGPEGIAQLGQMMQ